MARLWPEAGRGDNGSWVVHRYGAMTAHRRLRSVALAHGVGATTCVFSLGALIAGVVGCSSGGHGGPTPSTPVTGTFRMVGGPAPGIVRPLVGDVTVYSGTSASGLQVMVLHTDAKGQFHVDLAPGTFFFVGRSPDISGVPCTS